MKIYVFLDLDKQLPALLIENHVDSDSILGYSHSLSFNSATLVFENELKGKTYGR
jgi:hypothetical protein